VCKVLAINLTKWQQINHTKRRRQERRLTFFFILMFPDPNSLGCSFPNLCSIFVSHLPTNVDKEGNIKILKNEYWKTAGECINCGDLGPCYSHCIRCNPLGFLNSAKEIELDRIEIINDDPRSEGRMAHIVHSDILNQPDPAEAREQFLPFSTTAGWIARPSGMTKI
jgi:hypothetical protein